MLSPVPAPAPETGPENGEEVEKERRVSTGNNGWWDFDQFG